MVVELGDDDVGEKTWARPATSDRMVGRRRLHHSLAKPAGEGLTHVPHHLEATWTVLKTWSIGSISDSIGLDGFGAKACGDSQGFSISMIG